METVTLQGGHVRLEPLTLSHLSALYEAGRDPELWRWIPAPVFDIAGMREYIGTALRAQSAGTALPFVTVERSTNRVIGSTRYMNIDSTNRRVEIGSTWITPALQRTAINTEAKYLMMKHAFEEIGCIRVELKTDAFNRKSRNAILRIGAKEEGTLRSHMICHDGRFRDTVYFSVIAPEWPSVKAALELRLTARHS